jgi:hypothetical protein
MDFTDKGSRLEKKGKEPFASILAGDASSQALWHSKENMPLKPSRMAVEAIV